MLRLDWNLLFTVINILIIYFIVRKFLLAPVNKILEKRKAEVEGVYEQAGKAKDEAAALKAQYEENLVTAKAEKEETLNKARKDARTEYSRILGEAREKADEIMKEAQEAAVREREQVLEATDREIMGLVLAATAKIMNDIPDAKSDQALYDQFIAKAGDSIEAVRSCGQD